jgi:phosphopantetheine adenylyltransferase
MDFAEREGASMIIRGLRAVGDFEYEFQMAGMNQQLNNRIETVFLMADVSLQPIASGWSRRSPAMAARSTNSSPRQLPPTSPGNSARSQG